MLRSVGTPSGRRYKGKLARSRRVSTTVRVFKEKPIRTVQPGLKPKGKHQGSGGTQGRDGKVYVYEPPPLDGSYKCCKRKCFEEYQDDGEEGQEGQIEQARAFLFDTTLDKEAAKACMHDNWYELLLHSDGNPICSKMACKVYGCTKSKLYYKGTSLRRMRPSLVAENIAAWFMELKEVADIMPDEGWYQLNEPRKKDVHKHYLDDCKMYPECYHKSCESYFFKTWKENFPEVRLRRHCKFAKCSFCVRWRLKYETVPGCRVEARDVLRQHRNWCMIMERGCFQQKRDDAIQNPAKAISISIDGTDKVTFPSLSLSTSFSLFLALSLSRSLALSRSLPPTHMYKHIFMISTEMGGRT